MNLAGRGLSYEPLIMASMVTTAAAAAATTTTTTTTVLTRHNQKYPKHQLSQCPARSIVIFWTAWGRRRFSAPRCMGPRV